MKNRLPPGQRLSSKLIQLNIENPLPATPVASWDLEVKGLVAKPRKWILPELIAQFHDTTIGDFHCVTGWSAYDLHMEGLFFQHLLEIVEPLPEARHVLFQAEGVYTTNLPLDYLKTEPAIITWQLNSQSLERRLGGPLRLFVPGKYAYKAIKWLRSISFLKNEQLGYWEQLGYSNSADPWREERYA